MRLLKWCFGRWKAIITGSRLQNTWTILKNLCPMEINGYQLSRSWFDFCFDNPELINPNHTAIFMFAIEHCNRLGWKEKFGFPSKMTMDALGIKNHHTYIRYFNDLVDWGFFKMVQKSTNQYSANIISLSIGKSKNSKALDKAFIKHAAKQQHSNPQSTPQSNDSIDKPINQLTKEPINQEQEISIFGVKSDFQISVRKVYTGDKIKLIYDLKEFFSKEQIEGFKKSGWIKFDDFMKENPGRVFDDDNHVYNSFKNFHTTGNGKEKTTSRKFQQ